MLQRFYAMSIPTQDFRARECSAMYRYRYISSSSRSRAEISRGKERTTFNCLISSLNGAVSALVCIGGYNVARYMCVWGLAAGYLWPCDTASCYGDKIFDFDLFERRVIAGSLPRCVYVHTFDILIVGRISAGGQKFPSQLCRRAANEFFSLPNRASADIFLFFCHV